MHVLVLGGTGFVGRHMALEAHARGFELTFFNRGSDRALLPDAERVVGDRQAGVDALAGRRFDAVLDVNGYLPRIVGEAVRALRATVPRYAFVSTVSVYDAPLHGSPDSGATLREDGPLREPPEAAVEAIDRETYGPLKVACERVVTEAYGDAALLIRPGVVVGPHDPSDRFTYWVRRVSEGGDVLAPEAPDTPTQLVDARDLARWTVDALAAGRSGAYNVVAPAGSVTFGGIVDAVRAASEADARAVWVDRSFLAHEGVRPGADLPLWAPDAGGGMYRADASRALATGLAVRPLVDSARDTLAWDRGRGAPPLEAGLTREREAELLRAWRAGGERGRDDGAAARA